MEKLGLFKKIVGLRGGGNAHKIEVLMKRVDRLRSQEESFWQQRLRIKWLQEEDVNTLFFYQSTMQRQRWNKVVSLKADSEEWVDNPQVVRSIIDSHFTNLFTLVGQREWGSILECVTHKVTVEMNETLTAPISVEEIKEAALQIGSIKAPGPNGF